MYSKQYFIDPSSLQTKMDSLIRVYNLATSVNHGLVGEFDAAEFHRLDYGNGTGIVFLRVSIGEVFLGYTKDKVDSFNEFSRLLPHDVENILYFVRAVLTDNVRPEFVLWRKPDDTVWNDDGSKNEAPFIALTDPLFMSPQALYNRVFDTFYHSEPGLVPEEFSMENVLEALN